MGIITNPDATLPFCLKSDADKPSETRPTFDVRLATLRLRGQHNAMRNKAASLQKEAVRLEEAGDDKAAAVREQLQNTLLDMALLGVTGWQNVGGRAFTPNRDCLLDALGETADLTDLACNWPDAALITEDDRKNSPSPQPTGAVSSAPTVAEPAAKTTGTAPTSSASPAGDENPPAPPADPATTPAN